LLDKITPRENLQNQSAVFEILDVQRSCSRTRYRAIKKEAQEIMAKKGSMISVGKNNVFRGTGKNIFLPL